MILSLLFLALTVGCYSISQLQQHGKVLHWSGDDELGFFGYDSWRRKYKSRIGKPVPRGGFDFIDAPNNWYYRFFKIKFKERFPLSATLLVFLTDGYHLAQFCFLLLLSVSVTFALGFGWWTLFGVWIGVHGAHFLTYKFLSR